MKKALLLLVLLSCATFSKGQTIFTNNDVPQIGDTLYFAVDNGARIPNLETVGTNLIWDFTDLYPSDLALNIYLSPDSTPFVSDFPEANIALRVDFDQPSYSYFSQNDSLINLLGLSANIEELGGEALLKFRSAQLFAKLPTELGTSFRDTSIAEVELGLFQFQTTTLSLITTDGSGEIRLPGGNFPALRQQIITERRDSFFTTLFDEQVLLESAIEMDTIFLWLSPESKGIILSTDLFSGDVTYYAPDLENLIAPEAAFDFTLLANGPVTFMDNSINTPFQWNWDFGDGNTSTEQNPVHEFDSTGTFNVCLTVENSAGSNEICKMVSIIATSTQDLLNAIPIQVFPNPANQQIRFRVEENIPPASELIIFNAFGQIIHRQALQTDQQLILGNWSAGLYYYQIVLAGTLKGTGQFSIVH